MLLSSSVTNDGLIINQSELKTIPYGKYTSDYNGCGWIATYNAMKLLGEKVEVEEVLYYLNKYTILEGRFGTNPFGIKKYFEEQNYDFRHAFLSRKLKAKKNAVGILLYTDCKIVHYVAFRREDRKFHFYNDIYGKENDLRTLDEFLQGKKIPLWYLIVE
ncbi:hypothetical protein [Anaerocolumna sp.]|uniref:hypothetical protein n=1 Tax=Anaerocolumna sp. TaxID=2041569 RepID=UPI0028B055A5|nr:hypothetical protein [Anaerocolumna sp.]